MIYRFRNMGIGDAFRIIQEKGGVIEIPGNMGYFQMDGVEIINKAEKPCYITIWDPGSTDLQATTP